MGSGRHEVRRQPLRPAAADDIRPGAQITVTWTTDEASSSIVDYDTDATGSPYATSTAETAGAMSSPHA